MTAEVLAGVPDIELDDVEVCAEQTVTPVELPMFSGINWVWENNNVDVGLDESGQDEFPIWVAQNATTNEVSSTVTVLGQVASCIWKWRGISQSLCFLHLRQKCPCLQTGI